MKRIKLFTDGACSGNPGHGGWGCILQMGSKEAEFSDYSKDEYGKICVTTNNQMEIMGVIEGLRKLKEPCAVEVVTDSANIVNAFNKGWILKWRKDDWSYRPANVELWKQLWALTEYHTVTFTHVKGHAGHPENTRCDKLAKDAIKRGRNELDAESV